MKKLIEELQTEIERRDLKEAALEGLFLALQIVKAHNPLRDPMQDIIDRAKREERERLAKLIYGLSTEMIDMQGGMRKTVIEVHKLKTVLDEPKINF